MKCAIIGLGMVAPTHVAALHASDSVTLQGVLRRDPARARDFAAKHNLNRVYPDLDTLVADTSLDFVIVTTPPDARTEISARLIHAQLPVLMEKPVERTLTAAQDIVTSFNQANLPLGIVFQHRARAASKALKDAIDAGQLGEISHTEIRVPWWRDQSYYDAPGRGTYDRDGGGVMITQAIHTLDLALWLMGPVQEVQAMLATTSLHQLEAEDWAGGLLKFESGAVGTLNATSAAYRNCREHLYPRHQSLRISGRRRVAPQSHRRAAGNHRSLRNNGRRS